MTAQYPVRAVRAAFDDALRGGKVSKRHPAEVTSDRLGDAVSKWGELFTPQERDMIGEIRHALEEIAEGKRGGGRGGAGR